MTQDELNKVLEQHKLWLEDGDKGARANLCGADLRYADLRYANLRYANLRYANLRYADLRGADLDFSCFPIWCGGTRFKADDKFVAQMLAHLCSLEVSDKAREELSKVLEFAKTSHRAKECGLIKE